jgi:hypothetical protein
MWFYTLITFSSSRQIGQGGMEFGIEWRMSSHLDQEPCNRIIRCY